VPVKRHSRPTMAHPAGPRRRRVLIAGVPVGFLLAGVFGYGSPIAKAGASTPAWTAYVANFDSKTVTPIDTATGTTGAPIAVGSGPSSIAITPNGKTAYVVNGNSDTVTPINTLTNTPGAPIPVGSAGGSNPPLAVVANVTAVAGTATTFFTLFPSDASQPVASDLNPRPGDVVANLAFVGIATGSPSGDVSLYNQAGGINAILDVAGWFQ
jgi:YVTN family beta-propeller protein